MPEGPQPMCSQRIKRSYRESNAGRYPPCATLNGNFSATSRAAKIVFT